MDETYIKVGGRWIYLYRAVDKAGRVGGRPKVFCDRHKVKRLRESGPLAYRNRRQGWRQ